VGGAAEEEAEPEAAMSVKLKSMQWSSVLEKKDDTVESGGEDHGGAVQWRRCSDGQWTSRR
jgi:hypothetical protein